MKWYEKLLYRTNFFRGSSDIADYEGSSKTSSWNKLYFDRAYDYIEIVRRGTDIIVDGCAEVDISIKGKLRGVVPRTRKPQSGNSDLDSNQYVRQKTLEVLLRYNPNPYDDINQHRRLLYIDLVLTGNCYEYFDGLNIYHLPSEMMEIIVSDTKKVKGYRLNGKTDFAPHEIIHTRDNSADSTITGTSRLKSAKDSIKILYKMLSFQDNFFENGAVPGFILTTPNALGQRIKERMIKQWMKDYNPAKEGRKPLILDADLKPNPLSATSFRELDFENSVEKIEKKILKALGVPPILLDGGNNANIRPNLQLLYETTILPLTAKHIAAYEAFFAYDLKADVVNIRALRPELREASAYYQGLVNTGIITINEAREELRLPASTEEHADLLRIPANIAGSAANPSEGGRPEEEEDDSSTSEEENG